MFSRERAQGRSESLQATITEVMQFLQDDRGRPGGPNADLRSYLHEKLADLVEAALREGFVEGHQASVRFQSDDGRIPRRLRATIRRELFPGQNRRITLRSPYWYFERSPWRINERANSDF